MARTRQNILAFDDVVHGSADAYTSFEQWDQLGSLECHNVQVVLDQTSNVDGITVQVEVSNDGRNWVGKSPTPEIDNVSVSSGATQSLAGYDSGLAPGLAYARIRVRQRNNFGFTPPAHVKIWVHSTHERMIVPAQLQGCVFWFRADQGLVLDAGGNVQQWRDLTGNGYDAVQPASTRRPSPNGDTFNGNPSVFFDCATAGSEESLWLGKSLSWLTEGHFFLVMKRRTAEPPTPPRAGFCRLGTNANATHVPFTDSVIYDGTGSTSRYVCGTAAGGIDLAQPLVYEVRSASGAWSNRFNGVLQYASAANTVGFPSAPEIGGDSPIAPSGTYFDGQIAELALYSRLLREDERTALVGYLNARYRLGVT
jgi:hypothetical protein